MTAKLKYIQEIVTIPSSVTATVTGKTVTIKGKKGELTKTVSQPDLKVEMKDGKIIISSKILRKKNKMFAGTASAHIANMIKGVEKPFHYTLKICSGHFPINVSVANNIVSVKNFLGEKIPRTMHLSPLATVKINGSEIIVESIDIDVAGQTAAKIEQVTRITDKDRRVFQDCIDIISKGDK